MATRYAIRYESNSTVNGQPVGTVYAEDIGRISPGCWSYTKESTKATLFDSYDAAWAVRQRHGWPSSEVVEI